jgi:hypothetical protein
MSKFKSFSMALLALTGAAVGARAYDVKELLQEKFQLAEIFEGAAYAAEKCPGLRVIEDNVMATADEAGVTDDLYPRVEILGVARPDERPDGL